MVFVESEIQHDIFNKKIDFKQLFYKKINENDCFATRHLLRNIR